MKHEKSGDTQTHTDRRHPPIANYSPRRNLFRRGQKTVNFFSPESETVYVDLLVTNLEIKHHNPLEIILKAVEDRIVRFIKPNTAIDTFCCKRKK